jgi:undecaprenyl-diphosphatase
VTNRRKTAALALAMLLAIAATFLIDQPVARLMAGNGPDTIRIFKIITWFGQGGAILYPAGLTFVAATLLQQVRPRFSDALARVAAGSGFIFVSVAAAGLADDVLKIAFGRARPPLWLAGDDSGFSFLRFSWKFNSFPSGHTTTSFAAAIAFGALFPRFRILFFALAGAVGVSRLALDVHYLSDVAAGAALGIAIAILIRDRAREKGLLTRARAQDLGLASRCQEKNSIADV